MALCWPEGQRYKTQNVLQEIGDLAPAFACRLCRAALQGGICALHLLEGHRVETPNETTSRGKLLA
jgi:hypothetical protein